MDMKTNGYLLYKIYLIIVECQIFGLIKIVALPFGYRVVSNRN